ncbi:hypothetical protein BC831DRAFT_400568 [Entophlyctis helioformis]|nr:hypothetical protein BC831DRAFT_400568 [Entophlyctis helioformis]
MHADKASFFIVDTEKQHVSCVRSLLARGPSARWANACVALLGRVQLTSTVFDSGTESSFSVPLNKGIAGYVATTGKIVNLQDAYTDDRFNPEVDIKTNYRTRTILSVPVPGPKGNIVGVANLINKQPSGPNDTATPVFNVIDEEIFNSFAVFCGLALHKTMLLEEIDKQRQRLAITMEIMSFHSIVRDEETKALMDQVTGKTIPLDQLRSLTFDPHVFPHSDETLASITYQMFVDLSYGKRYDIPNEKLINYILTVRKNYRPVPYHNFTHAVSVTHAFYTLVVDGTLDGLLDHLERFAVFVACLNHDIDHRGTNNQFQKQAHTELANFYSTSTMERHHFNHAMTILSHGTGLNILEHLNTADYQRVLKIIEQSILATDLGMFFANRGKVNEILKNKSFNVAQTEHKDLLRGAIMTCCDLGAMYKPWKSSRSTADSVYEEFFQQGDEEKRLGMRLSAELMDRDKTPEIPRMQYDFYNFIVVPAYEQLFGFLGERVKPQYDAVLANKAKWKDLKDSGVAYKFGVDL